MASSPAKAGDPVFQRQCEDTEGPRRTGFPAFAGNDSREGAIAPSRPQIIQPEALRSRHRNFGFTVHGVVFDILVLGSPHTFHSIFNTARPEVGFTSSPA